MKDPVNNFEIPVEWIKKSSIPPEELKEGIQSGKLVLLSTGHVLHRGYTTGTTAAAAAKASVLSLNLDNITQVTINTPAGLPITIPVTAKNGTATAIKYSGDHSEDATDGIKITATAREHTTTDIITGAGIGIAEKDVFHLKKGDSAINPTPRKQIMNAIQEALEETCQQGARVLLEIPDGAEVAKKTLNEKLGITGGISILGTTGFVEPWSEHLQSTKEDLIKKSENIVLTTGRKGARYSHMLFPDHTIILVGSGIQKAIQTANQHNKNTILCGLPALILKWTNPNILRQTGHTTVQGLMDKNPDNPIINESISKAAKKHNMRIILVNKKGKKTHDTGEIS